MRDWYLLRPVEPVALGATAGLLGLLSGWAAYVTSPQVPLLLAGITAGAVLSVSRPIAAVQLAVALVPLEFLALELSLVGLTPAEVMFVIAGAGFAVRRLSQGQLPFVHSTVGWPLALLTLAVLPGLLIAPDPIAPVKVLVMWSAFLLVFNAVVAEGTRSTVEQLLLVLAASAAAVGAIALTGGHEQTLVGFGDIAEERATGSFSHANELAAYELMALPVAVALALRGPIVQRPVAGVASALCLLGLALSLSRGGLIAAGGAAAMLLLWSPFRRFVALAVAVVACLFLLGASSPQAIQEVHIVSKRISSVRYSVQGVDPRLDIWRATPRMIGDHPVFGVGAAAYPDVAPRYGLISSRLGGAYLHAHNVPLTIAAELGLVGLAALLWLAVRLSGTLLKACRSRHDETKTLGFALAASLVGFALQGMVDYTLRANVIAATAFVVCGCAVVVSRSDEQR